MGTCECWAWDRVRNDNPPMFSTVSIGVRKKLLSLSLNDWYWYGARAGSFSSFLIHSVFTLFCFFCVFYRLFFVRFGENSKRNWIHKHFTHTIIILVYLSIIFPTELRVCSFLLLLLPKSCGVCKCITILIS